MPHKKSKNIKFSLSDISSSDLLIRDLETDWPVASSQTFLRSISIESTWKKTDKPSTVRSDSITSLKSKSGKLACKQ